MNDTVSGTAAVAPPSSTPSAPESSSPAPSSAPDTPDRLPAPGAPIRKSSPEALGQLSAPEDVSEYAEQRLADEGQIEQQVSEPKKRANRYERLRKARDAAQAEAAALREQHRTPRGEDGKPENLHEQLHPEEYPAEPPDTDDQPPPEYTPTPEEAAEAHEQLRQQMTREQDIAADYRARERAVAAALPDYHATIAAAADVDIGPAAVQLLRESPHGPFIAYGLAATVDGLEILHKLKDADPMEVARFVAKAEATIEAGSQRRAMQQRQPPPQYHRNARVTNAPPPIKPLKGSGAGPTRGPAELANDMEAYARARKAQMREAKLDR